MKFLFIFVMVLMAFIAKGQDDNTNNYKQELPT